MGTINNDPETLKLPESWLSVRYMLIAVGLGLLGASVAIFFSATGALRMKYAMHSYLANFTYVMTFGIGAMFFILISHLTRAGWSSSIRRVGEIISISIPFVAVLFLPILSFVLFNQATPLYDWNQPKELIKESIVAEKVDYLNGPFFTVRAVLCLVLWSAIVLNYFRLSRLQDESGSVDLTIKRQVWSGPLVMLFALSVSMAAFDWVMSIDADWYSTIFGVYIFSGSMFGFFALMIVVFRALQANGKIGSNVNVEHYHDMGKFLFGFTMFWAYGAFSQFMLYWYGNIPEETAWFKHRVEGGWDILTYSLIAIHFAIPFLGLLSRHVRRHTFGLTFFAVWALVVHWCDITFLVMPNAGPYSTAMFLAHIVCGLGMSSIFAGILLICGADVPLVATRDPRLPEALSYSNPIL